MLEPDVILPVANLTLTMSNMNKLSQRGRWPRSSRASQSPGLTHTRSLTHKTHTRASANRCALPSRQVSVLYTVSLCQGRAGASRFIARLQNDIPKLCGKEAHSASFPRAHGNQTPLSCYLLCERDSEARFPLQDQTRPRSSIERALAQQQGAVCVTLSAHLPWPLSFSSSVSILSFHFSPVLSSYRSGEVDLLYRLISRYFSLVLSPIPLNSTTCHHVLIPPFWTPCSDFSWSSSLFG